MAFKQILSASALFTAALAATGTSTGTATSAGDSSLTLQSGAIQSGSFFDGSDGIGAESGEALALTSQNNFINFCDGQTLTNGLQITTGSCNGIPMGQVPAKDKMISSIIISPKNGQQIQSGQTFNITVQTSNLHPGFFTNADATYYSSPQQLDANGLIQGHTHVTVQNLGNDLNPTTPPDPTAFAFFKGINDGGNGQGLLSATVADGLPAGNYRLCTLTSSANHQPVLMPVAQRGSQDDCTKFTVIGNNNTENAAASDGSAGDAAAAEAASAVAAGPGAITGGSAAATAAATGAASAATTSAAAANGNGAAGGKSGSKEGGGAAGGNKADTTSAAAATSSSAAANKGGAGGNAKAATSPATAATGTTKAADAAATATSDAAAKAAATGTTSAAGNKTTPGSERNHMMGDGHFRPGNMRLAHLRRRNFVA